MYHTIFMIVLFIGWLINMIMVLNSTELGWRIIGAIACLIVALDILGEILK